MTSNAPAPNVSYIVFLPDCPMADPYRVRLSEKAYVQDLEDRLRDHPAFKRTLENERAHLFKCGTLDAEPPDSDDPAGESYKAAIQWLRAEDNIMTNLMDPLDPLKEYSPSRPASFAYKIDVIVVTDSIMESVQLVSLMCLEFWKDLKENGFDLAILRRVGILQCGISQVKLHGPVGTVEDQIAFILYRFLWRKAQNWKELVDTVEEDVPELQETNPYGAKLPSELVKRKASFLDLTKIPGWPKYNSRVGFKTTRLLIRQEYEELDSYIDENPKDHVILIGQPGIGKTIYLTYCLLKRLVSGKPTFFVLKPYVRYLFQESGVYWAPKDSFTLSRQGIIDYRHPDRRTLFDLNFEQELPVGLGSWPALVTSPPQEYRYKHLRKENLPHVQKFFMKTWEWTEIYMSREMAINKRTMEDWRCAYQKYGGSASMLLMTEASTLDLDIKKAICNCDKMDLLLRPWLHDDRDEVSDALVEINPLVEESGKIVRDIPTGRIISQYILTKILEEKKDAFVSQMKNVFRDLLSSKATRSAAGILFEGLGHVYVFKSRESPILLRSLDRLTDFTSLDLSSVKEIFNFTSRPSHTLDHNHYYRPLSGTLPGIDSFVLEADGDTHDTYIVLFQFNVGDRNPTNPTSLYTLWESQTKENGLRNRKWKLVFVVPDTIAVDYRKQPWAPASEEEIWDSRIDQYVLGVPDAKLWAAMREGGREPGDTSTPSS